jgi:hypothetical protein
MNRFGWKELPRYDADNQSHEKFKGSFSSEEKACIDCLEDLPEK